jgi:hypothetical protein
MCAFHASIARPPRLGARARWAARGYGFGECRKGTLPSDHLTENKPIRLAAPCVRRPRRSKNEGLRCGLYEIIDHIEGFIELRAEHVHNELEVQLERN